MGVVTIRAKHSKNAVVEAGSEIARTVEKKTKALLSEADRVLVVYGEGGAHIYYEDGQKVRA